MITKDKKHTKHANLTKPIGGSFHHKEWTFLGAPCDVIQEVTKALNDRLKTQFNIGFVDALHKKTRKTTSFHTQLTDKISHLHWQSDLSLLQKQQRQYFSSCYMVFVNGNHFRGDNQIVFMHEKKRESLLRKLDRLDNVKMILLEKSSSEIYPEVIDKMHEPDQVPIFRIDQTDKIAQYILQYELRTVPTLNGLILAGGKSTRMGEDKGSMIYYNKEQREYEADMLNEYCHRVFISCRKNQDELIESQYEKIYDSFTDLGPYGGILSAFREYPNSAWFTLATDLPYLNNEGIKTLIESRNPRKLATCYYNPETEFPEPLITIWEPKAYPILLQFLSMGYSCPRKVLINSDIEMIQITSEHLLKNANTKEEANEARMKLKEQLS